MDILPPFAGQPTATDPPITITLSVTGWHTVTEHVRRGICNEVYDVLTLIYLQIEPQIEAIERARDAAEKESEPDDHAVGDVSRGTDLNDVARNRSLN